MMKIPFDTMFTFYDQDRIQYTLKSGIIKFKEEVQMTEKSFVNFNLSKEIRRALQLLKYDRPTEVQSKVIPKILNGKDLVVQSKTGSGKTAAYGIPICEFVNWEENKPQVLVLTPTRELAVQVKEEITNIGRFKRVKAAAVYGKQPIAIQKTELKQKNHVVVGTPGRLYDHIQRGILQLDRIQVLVIDEADEMLNMGFIEQVEDIIRELPDVRQTLLFSATLSESVKELAGKYSQDPEVIEIRPKNKRNSAIEHFYYEVADKEKWNVFRNVTIVENPDSCIVFCRTKERVDALYEKLEARGYRSEKIHGGLKQEKRFQVMDDFRHGKTRYLIATDVAARGIDIEKISVVIHYDLPSEVENYIHRSGRTGRAGETGKSIAFVTEQDKELLARIETTIGQKMKKCTLPTREQVNRAKSLFDAKMKAVPVKKTVKSEQLNKEIMKLYFNGGKKKKLRVVDFVGTIAKIEGVHADDIGIITMTDSATYVDILNGKGPLVLKAMKNTTIKGKLLKVYEARQ